VTMDWADIPAATMQIWFGGESIGRAAADVISGADEPGGRLPHTIPVRLEDTPAFPYYPGEDGRTVYGEGLLIGHRHYATNHVVPRYWFGHGYGYTTFSFGQARVVAGCARATITNTGERRGAAVLQAYVAPHEPGGGEPALQFAGSARRTIAPGDSVEAEIPLDEAWLGRLRPGGYDVLLGWSGDPSLLESVGAFTTEE
jgi:beta-glucosidase